MLNGIKEFMRFTDACDGRKLVFFGASLFGAGIIRNFFYGTGGANDILYFCDNDKEKWGTRFCGKEVRPPSALVESKENIVVVVTSMYYPEIRKQLEEMGIQYVFYGNVLNYMCLQSQSFNELLQSMLSKGVMLPDCFEAAECRNNRKHINENYDKIEKVKLLLADEKSREIYQGVVDRKRYGFKSYEDICDYGTSQYFDSEIIKLGDNEVFVDVG